MTRGPRQSLTLLLPVRDAVACAAELEAQRAALEAGFARVPDLSGACLALLPASATQGAGLLFECSFLGPLADLLFVLFAGLGAELCAVLSQCADFPGGLAEREFAAFVTARAQRSSAFRAADDPEYGTARLAWQRLVDAWPRFADSNAEPIDEEALEARRLAVGMQEPLFGVPLLHVAWLSSAARPRVRRALRALEQERAPLERDLRFLLDGQRLLLFAYPTDNAQLWSERLSQLALPAFTRVWRHCRGFPQFFGVRRARRQRRLREFLLEQRLPLAVWFNAEEPLRSG